MRLEPFTIDELNFAWCHRAYFRFRTHRRKKVETLFDLQHETLSNLLEPYGIRVLELAADAVDVRLLASLDPSDSVSTAASKIKGRLSKWISECSPTASNTEMQKWLGRGYFAVTTGKSTGEDVTAYLDRQAEHHGYNRRVTPPVFIQPYDLKDDDERLLETDHAATRLRYHLVLATQGRQGVFSKETASAVTECWRAMHFEIKAIIQKVSFVPDHVHIAVALHPTVSPAAVVTALMNGAQNLLWKQFDEVIIRAGIRRLWQASVYVGSFGNLRSSAISSYVRRWESWEEL